MPNDKGNCMNKELKEQLDNFTEDGWWEVTAGYAKGFQLIPGTSKEEKNGRWDLLCECVVKHVPTDTYVSVQWSVGATEYQEVEADYHYVIVEPFEETVISYRRVT